MNPSFALILTRKSREFQSLLEHELKKFWEKQNIAKQSGLKETSTISAFIPSAFTDPCRYFFRNNSKKLRPILGDLLLRSLNGRTYNNKFKRILILPESLHSASLIVDDIEDSANIRRGHPCLHVKYGIDTAVNLANGLYFFPFFSVHQSSLPSNLKLAISNILTESMNRIHLGQGLDIFWHKNKNLLITPEQYKTMVRLKTSAFFRAEAQLAILLSGKNQKLAKETLTFAEDIGVAFQIIDDVLDVSPDTKYKFGKRFGQDIVEGKKTLIIALALERASRKEKAELRHILGLHTSDESLINRAITLCNSLGCIHDARNYAEKIISRSWRTFSRSLGSSPQKKPLQDYSEFLVQRKF